MALGFWSEVGRFFTAEDDAEHPKVVIIDETLARKVWPHETPTGKKLQVADSTPDGLRHVWMEVVGVVEHVRNHTLREDGREQVYVPYAQTPAVHNMSLAVRAAGDPASLSRMIEQETHALDKAVPVYNVRMMGDYVADAMAPTRFSLTLIAIFGTVTLLLASVGLYGVIAYSVSQRTREMGLRIALGARRWDIMKLVVGQGLRLTLVGVGLGLLASYAITRSIASLLYGVSATDPLAFAGAALLLYVVALLACYAPARRAVKVNPMTALRAE